MSRRGGTRTIRTGAVLSGAVLLCLAAGSLAGCTYEDDDGGRPPATPTSAVTPRPGRTIPAGPPPDVLAAQQRNEAALEGLLAGATGPVVLADSGPADGNGVGFQKAGRVRTAGDYQVTAACVGVDASQVIIFQDQTPTGPTSIVVDCTAPVSRTVSLLPGYIRVGLTRKNPTGPWTGALAGIRITGP
ncbi:hypothetical protein QWJ39_15535 [Arthrobacter sp. YD4]|uniref:hypothetical protein n=1 Tax=Arthrobacter sp. YD4 TaxID=3058043 RepID=UPI0025B3C40F|nr:hypothetical protein [Arthrobacter sp. YD4]MDN3937718.1 hypothetical protein [Arthrobacter sp. YD4]